MGGFPFDPTVGDPLTLENTIAQLVRLVTGLQG
jgi:hypothetical protein